MKKGFTPLERKAVFFLCTIFGFRMLGLFLSLPVLSPYANGMRYSTPILVGLAVGMYPLSQMLLQIPFGIASDRFGRRPVMAVGLLIFAAGNFWAARVETIWFLIAALALQGGGAIGAIVLAQLTDNTREEVRGRAMAMIGLSVGLAFGIGFLAGPAIAGFGIPRVFDVMGLLALFAFGLLFLIPTGEHRSEEPSGPSVQVTKRRILPLCFGVAVTSASLRGLFVVVPFRLEKHLPLAETWKFYLPVLLVSGALMFAFVGYVEARRKTRSGLAVAGMFLAAGLIIQLVPTGFTALAAGMLVYFFGFNCLEALLPSSMSKLAGPESRGAVMGLFNASQYGGAFLGSVLGGFFLELPVVLNLLLVGAVGLWLVTLFVTGEKKEAPHASSRNET